MYNGLGFNKKNYENYFNSDDGVHPNTLGVKRMGERLYNLLTGDSLVGSAVDSVNGKQVLSFSMPRMSERYPMIP